MSHVILWEFLVSPGHEREFEEMYGPKGAWATLFAKSPDYIETELLRDSISPSRYVTIDRWTHADGFALFRDQHRAEYEMLDARCESLTQKETKIGVSTVASHFHATDRALSPGSVVPATGGTRAYAIRAATAGHAWVDPFLDGRPTAARKPARATSAYCCPDIRCCARYAQSDLSPSHRVSEVLPRGRIHAAPMILVNRIAGRSASDPIAAALADEYWLCSQPWRYLEVLADELVVVKEVARPDSMDVLFGDACMREDFDRVLRHGW